MRTIITDGETRPALAVTRSLGQQGVAVRVGHCRGRALAATSRYHQGCFRTPDPAREPEEFALRVAREAAHWKADVVIPITDSAILALLANHERLPADVRLPLAHSDAIELAYDKERLLQWAEGIGLRVPRTFAVRRPDQSRMAVQEVGTPAVVKPSRSGDAAQVGRLRYFDRDEELARFLAENARDDVTLLVQERVEGIGEGYFALWDRGPVAEFAHRRLREKPPTGGVSVLCESIALEQDLRWAGRRLLNSLDWYGPAMVEFKRDRRTNEPVLMEINGRFWGSLQLAVDAGVDFPHLLLRMVSGERFRPPAYRTGVRLRWFWGDVDHLLLSLRGSPRRAAAMARFMMGFHPTNRSEILRLRDPRPAWTETQEYLATLVSGALRRKR